MGRDDPKRDRRSRLPPFAKGMRCKSDRRRNEMAGRLDKAKGRAKKAVGDLTDN
jgi:hypothetical protein